PRLPNVQTLREAGYGDVPAIQWVGVFAPAATPKPIVAKLNEAINAALKDPAFVARMNTQGMSPAGGTPEDLQRIVETEIPLWKEVARSAGMKLNE
ncbi:MAG TPA: tripartite tricarboxylate transporter substrate-binding protein, partial [Beijerinckiaceae bacterium]